MPKMENPRLSLREILSQRPGEAYIYPEGTWLAMLTGPDLDQICVVTAGDGKNFNDMSEEEINEHITRQLTKLINKMSNES